MVRYIEAWNLNTGKFSVKTEKKYKSQFTLKTGSLAAQALYVGCVSGHRTYMFHLKHLAWRF
jgi:hypothetical protein